MWNIFPFLTNKLLYTKNRFFVYFRRRHMEAAANNFCQFCEPKLQDIRHRYLWLKFQIFSLVNNWDVKEQNENLKNWILGGILSSFTYKNVKLWSSTWTLNDMPKKSLTSISICYVQEKNPFSFFHQIYLF